MHLVLLLLLLSGSAWAETRPHPVKAHLVSDQNSFQPGKPFKIALYLEIERGWHVYWKNPGDTGRPTQAEWRLPTGVIAGDFLWPYPRKFLVPPLVNYGYEGEVLLPFRVKIPGGLREFSFAGEISWLVCERECIPEKQNVSLRLPVRPGATEPDPAWRKAFDIARGEIPRPVPPGILRVEQTEREFVLAPRGLYRAFDIPASAQAEFFPLDPGVVQASEADPSGLRLRKAAPGSTSTLRGVLVMRAEGQVWPLEVEEMVEPLALLDRAPGSLLLLALAFLGGLILNLMPCVFPVLGIKLMALMESSRASSSLLRLHATAYAGGILASFWLLAGVLLLVKAGGHELGWGFQLQQPWFVTILALLFFLMALNLTGLFEVGGRWVGVGQRLTEREGVWGSFFTGVLAVVVSTPCSAPFMGTAVGAALLRPGWETILIFTALGLGLASPYLLISAFPDFLRLLPRPGAWMNHLKEALAIPLFGTVAWLLWIYEFQKRGGTSAILVASLFGVFLILGLRRAARPWFNPWRLAVLALFFTTAAAVPWIGSRETTRESGQQQNAWMEYSPEALEAERRAGRAVFVDFTAEWCLTCKVNERLVLNSPEMRSFFRSERVALLRADWTSEDPAITRALAGFGRAGVPLYVAWPAGAKEPRILPQVLTPALVKEGLKP
ncbi:MAG: thioredoxin family protein [Bdellovibrionales bacterium]|nr:thioredoxin family protein [Bdellovibrionales bacterium]